MSFSARRGGEVRFLKDGSGLWIDFRGRFAITDGMEVPIQTEVVSYHNEDATFWAPGTIALEDSE